MPRFNEIINNFINGEISPRTYGRMDSEIYKRSCRTLKNMISHPQGGATRRVGSQEITDVLPGGNFLASGNPRLLDAVAEGARIVPFIYSSTEKYLIIFNKHQNTSAGDNFIHYIRVDNQLIAAAGASPNAFAITGPITARTSTNLSVMDNYDTMQLTATLDELQYTQAGSYMIFTHETIPPFVVARTSEGTLQLGGHSVQYNATASTDFGPVPFMDLNVSDLEIKIDVVGVGNRTLTATAAIFNAGHIGSMWCFQDGGVVGIGIVTAFASTTSVSFEVTRDLPAGAATGNGTKLWYEGAWSDYRGWPRTVSFWNNALHFGGSPTFPDRMWRSQIYDIFEMSNLATQDLQGNDSASDPFYGDLAVGSGGVPKINFLVPGTKDLIVGTQVREFAVSAFEKDNFSSKPQTGYGAEQIQPVLVDDVPVYVQRGFRKLREIVFDDRTSGYLAPEVTFLAEHMPRLGQTEISGATTPKIKQLAYQALDNNVIWAIDNNGFLFACTKSRENTVTAFHRHDVGGKVRSIASLPSSDGTFDELWMVVERTVNSATVYYLEKISGDFYGPNLTNTGDAKYLRPVFSDVARSFRRMDTPTFWAQLKDGINADISGGTATATETGTITYGSNRAIFDASSYLVYDGTDNADIAQVGCVRVWASIVSLANNTLFSISQSAASVNNLIRLRTNGGNLHLTINDSAGSAIINDVDFGDVAALVGSLHAPVLIELSYDLTAGVTQIFVNGKQLGATNASTGTRNTTIDNIVIGAQYDGSDPWDGYLYDFSIFATAQNTGNYETLDFLSLGVKVYKLDHLEGESVQVVADGNYVGDFTVSGGEIADIGSDYSTSTIITAGLAYTHLLEIQPIDLGSGIGSAMGSIKRVDRAVVRFNASAAAKVGSDTSNLEEIVFRDTATPSDEAIVLVTADKEVQFLGDHDREARAVITHDAPLPCSVTCLSLRGITADS